MKPTNLLLLDLNPAYDLGRKLRGILESVSNANIHHQEGSVKSSDTTSRWAEAVTSVVSRVKPAVIFVVSPNNVLKPILSLFQSLNRWLPRPPVVPVSDTNSRDELLEAIKQGADDFITPPLDPVEIYLRLQKLLEQTCGGETLAHNLVEQIEEKLRSKGNCSKPLIGQSESFLAAVRKLPNIAISDDTVLISGETGTGKEVCARAIHHLSNRATGSFVPVNCGAFPELLIESELFGHERGAFTGAVAANIGLIREAEGGTLFLDELDSLPLPAQSKLLRFLHEKEYRPVGSTKSRIADVRVIAATNVNLTAAVEAGRIRRDLYYRLTTFQVDLPPLRERTEDIRVLAAHFLARTANRLRKNVNSFSPDALLKLCLYEWPGNVRELESVVTRAVTFTERSIIHGHDLSLPDPGKRSYQERKDDFVREWERREIIALLVAHDGNVCRAAAAAMMDPRVMRERLRKLGIDPDDYRPKGYDDDSDE
jgi:DNA-binding NtrC family response regulator